MKKASWKAKVRRACEEAGTYQPFFESVIDTLAGIMEMRDQAIEIFKKMGSNTVYAYTNKGGNKNLVKNPALVVIMDCNAQALAYWKELGLTSRSYKTMTGSLEQKEEGRSLEDALQGLGI